MEKKSKPSELKYEIINEIGVVSTKASWRLEVNRVSWDGREPKYDIRSWSAGRMKMGKGITLTEEELVKFYEVWHSISSSYQVLNVPTRLEA